MPRAAIRLRLEHGCESPVGGLAHRDGRGLLDRRPHERMTEPDRATINRQEAGVDPELELVQPSGLVGEGTRCRDDLSKVVAVV